MSGLNCQSSRVDHIVVGNRHVHDLTASVCWWLALIGPWCALNSSSPARASQTEGKPRVIIETDAGGDPDVFDSESSFRDDAGGIRANAAEEGISSAGVR